MAATNPELRLSRDMDQATSPLKRQLIVLAHISRLLLERGCPAPVLIGGCALAYYTREVYFTADIDLAYADRESLDSVLGTLGFTAEGRYWVHRGLDILVEAPTSSLSKYLLSQNLNFKICTHECSSGMSPRCFSVRRRVT